MKKFIVGLLSMFFAGAAHAYTCGAGYYLGDNNECVACNTSGAYYCPGDDTKHNCPQIDDNFYQWAYDTYGFTRTSEPLYWTSQPSGMSSLRTGVIYCIAYHSMRNDVASSIYFSVRYDETNGSYTNNIFVLYLLAEHGYYLKQAYDSANTYWRQSAACTNAPANAHYTGAGTNDTYDGTVVDANDCPWECDSGYGQTTNGQCLALCGAGITELHVGDYVFNLYATKQTSPALYIKYNDTICYVSLATGTGTNAMHIKTGDGTIYHTVN